MMFDCFCQLGGISKSLEVIGRRKVPRLHEALLKRVMDNISHSSTLMEVLHCVYFVIPTSVGGPGAGSTRGRQGHGGGW